MNPVAINPIAMKLISKSLVSKRLGGSTRLADHAFGRFFAVLGRVLSNAIPVLLVGVALSACSGGGAGTQQNQVTSGPTAAASYTGPAPTTADIQAFKNYLWSNINGNDKCGRCHYAGGQTPNFARSDDVNLAYQAAVTVVNLNDPSSSTMVTKVGGGHNCWLASPGACGDIMTTWISNWANASGASAKQVQLVAPPIKDAGGAKNYPADAGLFSSTVYPLLTQFCSRCHTPTAQTPQSPFFAQSSVTAAYLAAEAKMDLNKPANSRFVVRLRDESHNCWGDCAANAAQMQAAIQAFADQVPVTQVNPSLVLSKALSMYDGTVASGANRFDSNAIAIYQFKTGTGTTAYDTSGVSPELDLTLSGNVTWVGGWGINLAGGKAQGLATSSKKLHDLIAPTGEYTLEAWVAPANVAQDTAVIAGYSGGTALRDFTLSQSKFDYVVQARSSVTDGNGMPALKTADAAQVVQATLQHVVVTFDPINGRRLYVNGVDTGVVDSSGGGALNNWDDTFALVLGNEVSGNRPWSGVVRFLAIHNHALTATQIQQNFNAGVGERYFLLFDVSTLVNLPQSYIMFEVSQYDSYSYLFNKPTFINLDPNAKPDNITVRGMRIGMNGNEVPVGQAYIPLNTAVTAGQYSSGAGQLLTNIGTVIALQNGPSSDLFFLTFEQLGSHLHAVTEAAPLQPPPPADTTRPPDLGLRVFNAMNATMAKVTGVSPTTPNIMTSYQALQQQLPNTTGITTFSSAQQVAIAQLATAYCDALVEDGSLAPAFFPGLNFNTDAGVTFGTSGGRNLVINPLLSKVVGSNLATQPSADITTELNNLMVKLSTCSGSCSADRTKTVTKAACATVVGSAAMLVQ